MAHESGSLSSNSPCGGLSNSPCQLPAVAKTPARHSSGVSYTEVSVRWRLSGRSRDRFLAPLASDVVTLICMSDVTRLLDAAAAGDRRAAADLLPLVYGELRRLAAARMAAESPDHTLDATALVHEAYLRLVGPADDDRWDSRGHFFAAAALAMRRVLVDTARRKQAERRGGGRARVALEAVDGVAGPGEPHDRLVSLDSALTRLGREEPQVAAVVNLRYFAGLTIEQAAAALGVSVRTANRHWAYAKAWLYRELGQGD